MQPYENILKFWFGQVEDTIVPSEKRARIWFGEDPDIDHDIKEQFNKVLLDTIAGEKEDWKSEPRGQLAMIIVLDQFSRHVYRSTPKAYAQDAISLDICINGIQKEVEHGLSLIERVFYYFPLLHSEDLTYQEQSLHAYQILADLAFSETRVIYDSFYKFANHHYSIIQRFGRFPQRNVVLGRESTAEELIYLQELDDNI